MASLIEDLIDVLENELDIYRQLIPTADKKTRIIIDNDLEGLQDITEKEQIAVEQINTLERRRVKIMENIKTVLNYKSDDLNLAGLIILLEKQPQQHNTLSNLHDSLKAAINRLSEINGRNKTLIDQSLEMIEFNMNFIQSTRMSQGNNYTKGAQQYNMKTPASGMFDTKQ